MEGQRPSVEGSLGSTSMAAASSRPSWRRAAAACRVELDEGGDVPKDQPGTHEHPRSPRWTSVSPSTVEEGGGGAVVLGAGEDWRRSGGGGRGGGWSWGRGRRRRRVEPWRRWMEAAGGDGGGGGGAAAGGGGDGGGGGGGWRWRWGRSCEFDTLCFWVVSLSAVRVIELGGRGRLASA